MNKVLHLVFAAGAASAVAAAPEIAHIFPDFPGVSPHLITGEHFALARTEVWVWEPPSGAGRVGPEQVFRLERTRDFVTDNDRSCIRFSATFLFCIDDEFWSASITLCHGQTGPWLAPGFVTLPTVVIIGGFC